MSEHKPGFTYIFSKTLKQEIAMSNKTGRVYCQDGTQYSAEEVLQLQKTLGEIPLEVHLIKKHFGGTIISTEEKRSK